MDDDWRSCMNTDGLRESARHNLTDSRTQLQLTWAAARLDRLTTHLWAMAANQAPKQPDDTHVQVMMPVAVWEEFRP